MLETKRVQGTYVSIEYKEEDVAHAKDSPHLGWLQMMSAQPVPGVIWTPIVSEHGRTTIGYKLTILVEPNG